MAEIVPLDRVLRFLGHRDARVLASTSTAMLARVRIGALDLRVAARMQVRLAEPPPGLVEAMLRARRATGRFIDSAPWREVVEAGGGARVEAHPPAPPDLLAIAHGTVYEPTEDEWRGQIAIFTWTMPGAVARLVLSTWSTGHCDVEVRLPEFPGLVVIFGWVFGMGSPLPRTCIRSVSVKWTSSPSFADVAGMAAVCKGILRAAACVPCVPCVPARIHVAAPDADRAKEMLYELLSV